MSISNPCTAIIILNYNNSTATRNCIRSVKKFTTSDVKYMIIDNGSHADDYEALKGVMDDEFNTYSLIDDSHLPQSDVLPKAVLVRSDENLGYARGNNFGLKYVYDDPEIINILIINNDILFVEDIIPAFIKAQKELPDCAVLTPLLLKKDGKNIDPNCARRQVKLSEIITEHFLFYWWHLRNKSAEYIYSDRYLAIGHTEDSRPRQIQLPSGSCMFVNKDFFKSIDGFDPNTFLYQEENILFEKIKRTGRSNYLLPYISCIHLGSDTISNVPDQVQLMNRAIQSEEYFVMEYLRPGLFKRMIYQFSKWFFLKSFALQKAVYRKK